MGARRSSFATCLIMAARLDPGGSDLKMSLVAELHCWRRQSASTGPFALEVMQRSLVLPEDGPRTE